MEITKLLNQSSKLSLTRPMHLIQLWKALDFRGKFFNCCKRLMHFLKPGFSVSCKDRKHMFANTFLLSCLRIYIVVMIVGIHISQEIFAIDMLTVLKPFLEHDRKLVLRLSRLHLDGDQASISCGLYIFCPLDISVESIGRFICCQDRSNKESLFIRPQFGSQFGVSYLLGFIKPMQHFSQNVFVYTHFKTSASSR